VSSVVPNAIGLAPLLRNTPQGAKTAEIPAVPGRRESRNVGRRLR
jgi:hypothetical protein